MADNTQEPKAPLNMDAAEFRRLGHALVDQIGDFLESLPHQPLTKGLSRKDVQAVIGQGPLPGKGLPADALLDDTARMLFEYSLHNGHPLFLGYITSSAAPLGALADLLASSINANVCIWDLSPVASEIETQTVQWLAEFIGYPADCGGIMVSGGNMANMLGFFAARRAQADWNIREEGLYAESRRLTVYASRETHTWVEKAADVSGIGTNAIRWIDTDAEQRIKIDSLENQIRSDIQSGCLPFLLIGTAGNVSTGAIDPLARLADLATEHGLWYHVDGAYGAPAAVLPDAPADLRALPKADSIALDPHKWLYSPIEAACTLVRDPQHLLDAFEFQPPYYAFHDSEPEPGNNYYALGLQNSRGFRALKVWLALRHLGREGYVAMIGNDIALAEYLFDAALAHPDLEACTQNLSITTLRFVPEGFDAKGNDYLNALNTELLTRLQQGGQAFVSNAIVDGRYLLRACVVNFRTTRADMDRLVTIIVDTGRELHREMG
jgi:aromatic-L-amino-acid decarboxylase